MSRITDIVIPLGTGSAADNFELRMALRSIARYGRNIGTVFIVSDALPAWCHGVCHVKFGDRHRHNKDANLMEKILAVCSDSASGERFLFWSDDQLALASFDAATLIPVYNDRNASHFQSRRIWHNRMRHTFKLLEHRGIFPAWNWDSHVPQPMEKTRFRELIAPLDFAAEPGYCINTLYFGLCEVKPLVEQSTVKCTLESNVIPTHLPENKLFLGYNDTALTNGLAKLLEKHFPAPCVYEK